MKRRNELGPPIPFREVTPESIYLRRRELMAGAAALAGGAALGVGCPPVVLAGPAGPTSLTTQKGPFGTDEAQTPFKDVTTYNNFYELGTDKSEPAENAHTLKLRPWTVAFEGEIKN